MKNLRESNMEYTINGIKLITSDDEIKQGDFFLEIIENGLSMPHINQLIDLRDYLLNGIYVVTVDKIDNSKNYKKITNL